MIRPRLAVPDLYGQCSVCLQGIPATPAEAPYEGKARVVVHPHPRAELGQCVGSRMVTWPLEAPSLPMVQCELFTAAELRRAA